MIGGMRLPDQLYERDDRLAAVLLAANVAIVGGSGIFAYRVGDPLVWALAFLLVGARGQACYILQHEAMHNLLFSNRRLNDAVGVVLSAFLGTQFYFGRVYHMKHHREVGGRTDPNEFWHKTEGKEPKLKFIGFLLFQLLGGRLLLLALSLTKSVFTAAGFTRVAAIVPTPASNIEVNVPERYRRVDLLALLLVQLCMLVMFTLLAKWWVYFILYVLPLSTLTALFEAIRSFSEHVLPGAPTNEVERNRRFYMNAGPVERFFVSQFGFHYHHVHHVHVNVPTFNVKRAHQWLSENEPDFTGTYIERPGYVKTALLYLFERPFPGKGGMLRP